MTNPIVANPPKDTLPAIPHTVLHGAGLFYGENNPGGASSGRFSMTQWANMCAQAKAWGMTYLHPKVAEGNLQMWFSDAELNSMKKIANDHGLYCLPVHFLYGEVFGEGAMNGEVDKDAKLVNIFGGVILDMEDQWNNRPQWAVLYGQKIRARIGNHGLLLPTCYANPNEHPFPVLEVNAWADAFLPQVYFDLWTGQSAQQAMNYISPEWQYFADHLWNNGRQQLKPVLPVIGTTNNVPVNELIKWIESTAPQCHYTGFWYDGVYNPYAAHLLPVIKQYLTAAAPTPTPTPAPKPVPPPPAPKPAAPAPVLPPEPALAKPTIPVTFEQKLTYDQLKAIYQVHQSPAPATAAANPIQFDPAHLGICNMWVELIQKFPHIAIGSPLSDEKSITINGIPFSYIKFDSGRIILYDKRPEQRKLILV